MARSAQNRRRGRLGNVAMLVALLAVPLSGMVALSVDFGYASVVKGRLDLAADAAALLATTAASNAWRAGQTNAVQQGTAAAQGRFDAESANQPHVTIAPVSVVVTQNGGRFTATVSYTASTPTTFARVLGITTLPVSGRSSSSLSANPYIDVQVLMDVSGSMTIAGTAAAITQMQQLTTSYKAPKGVTIPGNAGQSCMFACHWTTAYTKNYVDYYQLALNKGVQLRLTFLQNAVSNLISTMAAQDISNRFRLGLYTFNAHFNTVYPLSQNISAATSFVSGIAPDVNFCANDSTCPETFFTAAMQALGALGATPPAPGLPPPQRYLIIVTDGVYDQYVGGTRSIGAFNPADCQLLKNQGVTILVLYTQYLAPTIDNPYYDLHVKPISGLVKPNLQACASSTTYELDAADATDINTQLQAIFQLVVQTSSHLTN